jgi:hypothetical protein
MYFVFNLVLVKLYCIEYRARIALESIEYVTPTSIYCVDALGAAELCIGIITFIVSIIFTIIHFVFIKKCLTGTRMSAEEINFAIAFDFLVGLGSM